MYTGLLQQPLILNLCRNMGPNMLSLSPLSTNTPRILVIGFVYVQCKFAETPKTAGYIQHTRLETVQFPYLMHTSPSSLPTAAALQWPSSFYWFEDTKRSNSGLLLAFVTPLPAYQHHLKGPLCSFMRQISSTKNAQCQHSIEGSILGASHSSYEIPHRSRQSCVACISTPTPHPPLLSSLITT